MRNLILTGFMGTGKTTVGHLLARRFGLQLADLDEEIEKRTGRTIGAIFAESGEDEFRRMERRVFKDVLDRAGQVIATGGGTLLSQENLEMIGPADPVVCLTCSAEEIERRLGSTSDRPLLASPGQSVTCLMAERDAAYRRFRQLDTSGKTPHDVAGEIGALLHPGDFGRVDLMVPSGTSVHFETGSLASLDGLLRRHHLEGDCVLVTDRDVAGLPVFQTVIASLQYGRRVHLATVPAGEQHKTLETLEMLYGLCMEWKVDRGAVVLGLGGGVVCDLSGMLAATYLRGLRLCLLPTTLLAQADAAIGGKVGVDFHGVKNIVGSFYPARLVVVDPQVLETLSCAALMEGIAEIVKIGMVRSAELVAMLDGQDNGPRPTVNPAIIRRAIEEKVKVVAADPRDDGMRALLNFGHTVGHALEADSRWQLPHGSAVSVGMAAETWLAVQRGVTPPTLLDRLTALLERFELPIRLPTADPSNAGHFLSQDKKRRDGKLYIAVPADLGHGTILEVTEQEARAAVARAVGPGRE